MSLPVSTGDIIAVSILIKDIIKALDDSKGSAAEYQEVIRELWSLDKALLEIEHLSHTYETTIELNALSCTARQAAEQCRLYISAFLDKIKLYKRSLGPGGSGSRLKDTAKRIQWTFAQKDELARFRAEVNGHTSAINMLLITASLNITRLTGRNINNKVIEAEKKHDASFRKTASTLSDIQTGLTESNIQLGFQSKRLDAQEEAGSKLKNDMKYFATLSSELKELMTSILTAQHNNYKFLLDFQSRIPSEFKPCWIQEPVMFTDALGRIMPIHIELINSWEVFDIVLAARFENLPGKGKIARKEVAFVDRYLAKDVERCQSFNSWFLPGRRIDMSMIFKQKKANTSCPKCGLETNSTSGRTIQCKGCYLWLQRVEEVADDSADKSTESPEIHSKMGNMPPGNQASRKRKRSEASGQEGVEDIRAFQRVRLLLKPGESNDFPEDDPLKSRGSTSYPAYIRVAPQALYKTAHNKPNWPLEAHEAKVKPTQPASTYDLSPFLYNEDEASQQYHTCTGSSDDTTYGDLLTTRNGRTFPNPYAHLDFYHWLFGEEDTNSTGIVPEPIPSQLTALRSNFFLPQDDNYLSSLLEASD